ncbi:MAG: hypothetical protein HQ564_05835 [Candidatus Saganbacteria bacterium]|nr:hypothetical protein [Candidatus Saganbacteria bacterium]
MTTIQQARGSFLRTFGLRRKQVFRQDNRANKIGSCIRFLSGHLNADLAARFITKNSRATLIKLSEMHPHLTSSILSNLKRAYQDGLRPNKLILSIYLLEPQNQTRLVELAQSPSSVLELVDENKNINFARGIRTKSKIVDNGADVPPGSFEEQVYLIRLSREALIEDAGKSGFVGNFALFRSVLRARVELYRLGRMRSQVRDNEDPEALEYWRGMIQGLADQMQVLLSLFPFGERRVYFKEQINKALELLRQQNDSAANSALVPITGRLEKIILSQATSRAKRKLRRSSRGVVGSKIRMDDKGGWHIIEAGYGKRGTEIKHKIIKQAEVPTEKILSRVQHQIDNISADIDATGRLRERILSDSASRKEEWFKLGTIFEELKSVDDLFKEKAQFEIEAARDLVDIGTTQAEGFAGALKRMAVRDLEKREEVLRIQLRAFPVYYSKIENHLRLRVSQFAQKIISRFKWWKIMVDPSVIDGIDRILGSHLGGIFLGDMREEFLQKSKSRFYGTKRGLVPLKQKVKEKQGCLYQIVQKRQEMIELKKAGDKSGRGAEVKKEVVELFRRINRLNKDIIDTLETLVRFFLMVEFDLGRAKSADQFWIDNSELLSQIAGLNSDKKYGHIIDNNGKHFVSAHEEDAKVLGLKFEKSKIE